MADGASGGGRPGGLRRPASTTRLVLYFQLDSSFARDRILEGLIPKLAEAERATIIEVRPKILQLDATGSEDFIAALRHTAVSLRGIDVPRIGFQEGRNEITMEPVWGNSLSDRNPSLAGLPSGIPNEPFPGLRPALGAVVGEARVTAPHPERVSSRPREVGSVTQGLSAYARASGGVIFDPASPYALAAAERIAATVLPVSAKTELKQTIAHLIAEAKGILESGNAPVGEGAAPPSSPVAGAAAVNATMTVTGAAGRLSAAVLHIDRGLEAAGVTREHRDNLIPAIMTYMRDRQMWGGGRRKTRRRRGTTRRR